MNDKLWKTIQILSILFVVALFGFALIISDLKRKANGHLEILFPSKGFQITGSIITVILILIWVFATQVRREGEVSFRAVQKGVMFIIVFGIFYLFLKSLH